MVKLTKKQIAALWITLGGDPNKAAEAAAVAWCESDGNTKAAPNWAGAAGLWQFIPTTLNRSCALNPVCATKEAIKLSKNGTDWSPWDCHPHSRSRTGSLPAADTRFAQGLAETTTVGFLDDLGSVLKGFGKGGIGGALKEGGKAGTENLYDLLPDETKEELEGAGGILGGGIDAIGQLPGVLEKIAQFFVGLGEFLFTPEGWLRLGKLIGGSVVLLWGLNVLIKQTTGTNPAAAVRSVTPVG